MPSLWGTVVSDFRPYWMSQPGDSDTPGEEPGYKIDPFLLDLPTADPASLPAATLDPDTIRRLRDRDDPITAHRTRRNR